MGAHQHVDPETMAPAVGFSHAVVAAPGTTVHLGGQVAFDPHGTVVGETVAEQYGLALGNLVTALRACGGEPQHIVSMVVFVTDMAGYRGDLRGVGAAHRSQLGRHFPAMALVGVTELVEPDARVEVMATAVIPDDRRDPHRPR